MKEYLLKEKEKEVIWTCPNYK